MKKTIFAAILLLTLLSACQYLGPRKDVYELPEVNIGTQGVELFFAPNTPPPEVYEGSPFTLLVTLSNLGTTDVDNGVYSLGYEKQYLYVPRGDVLGRFRVRGKSPFNPQGDEQQQIFIFNTKPLGAQIERYPASITFNACYPYKTAAPLPVCIDTDITGRKSGKVCTPTPQNFPGGQGAPVTVASIEPRMLPHEDPRRMRPEFVITIRNQGSGDPMATQLFREACTGRPLGEESWNIISVRAALSDILMTCTPSPVKLRTRGETKVICTIPEGIDVLLGSYTELLNVELEYGYLTSISTQVNIVKPTY